MRAGEITKAAWKLLADEQITCLPVRPSQIARTHQIAIHLYETFAHSAQCSMEEVVQRYGPDGFTVRYPGAQYLIFYNHGNPQRARWTIMHELAHVFLGHIHQGEPVLCANTRHRDFYDVQADNFAARVLCPDVVAHFCGVRSAQELRKLTDLSAQASENRWKDLCARRLENDFLTDPGEKAVYQNFRPFISAYCADKTPEDSPVELPPGVRSSYRL